jgi:hypothetical protein
MRHRTRSAGPLPPSHPVSDLHRLLPTRTLPTPTVSLLAWCLQGRPPRRTARPAGPLRCRPHPRPTCGRRAARPPGTARSGWRCGRPATSWRPTWLSAGGGSGWERGPATPVVHPKSQPWTRGGGKSMPDQRGQAAFRLHAVSAVSRLSCHLPRRRAFEADGWAAFRDAPLAAAAAAVAAAGNVFALQVCGWAAAAAVAAAVGFARAADVDPEPKAYWLAHAPPAGSATPAPPQFPHLPAGPAPAPLPPSTPPPPPSHSRPRRSCSSATRARCSPCSLSSWTSCPRPRTRGPTPRCCPGQATGHPAACSPW